MNQWLIFSLSLASFLLSLQARAQNDAAASREERRIRISTIAEREAPPRVQTGGMYQSYLDCLAALKSEARMADSENFLIPTDSPSGFYLVRSGNAQFYGMGWIEARKCYHDEAGGGRVYSLGIVSGHDVFASVVRQKNGRTEKISTEKLTTPFMGKQAQDKSPVCHLLEGPNPTENVTRAMLAKEASELIDGTESRFQKRIQEANFAARASGEKVVLPNAESELDALRVCRGIKDETVLKAIDKQEAAFSRLSLNRRSPGRSNLLRSGASAPTVR